MAEETQDKLDLPVNVAADEGHGFSRAANIISTTRL